MDIITFIHWLHVIGACILLGTGAGIAFFMLMAHRTGEANIIAHTASIAVFADTIFTATTVVIQPITGVALATMIGWSLTDGWIALSIGLYIFTGAFWLPVVWIQIKLRNLAIDAELNGSELPRQYHKLFKLWFLCGIPAFVAVLLIVWLMLARPYIDITLKDLSFFSMLC